MRTIAGIYKAYDIRGIVDKELDADLAYWIGRAFVRVTRTAGTTVCVGKDMRPSSVPYAAALIEGMLDEGASVMDAGLVSTPLFYFATRDYAAGVMVTASHNPKEYNGFKFCRERAIPVSYDTGIREIERLVGELRAEKPAPNGKGTIGTHDFLGEFLDENLCRLRTRKPMTIVVDAANGMGGLEYAALAQRLAARTPGPIRILPLYFDLDGSFPNHEANPLKEETLVELQRRVKAENGATLGLALDGDGDRCVFLDERGEVIRADLFLALIAQELLKTRTGGTVLHDLRSSRIVAETIRAAGGKPVMCRVGHAYIKAQMREEHALLAGELSGHFYPGEANYTENTMYALFAILNLLEATDKPLSELVAPLQKYAFSGEINSKVADADATLAAAEKRYAALPGIRDLSHLDGVRIEYATWWFSLRKSNTEPVVRLIVEADTQQEMETRRDELLGLIRS